MKANEVPEKIYIQPSVIEQLPHQNIVYTKPLADNSIEYTRTDAFIDKAVLYLIHNTSVVHYPFGDIREFKNNFDEMLKDFRNYMKRE